MDKKSWSFALIFAGVFMHLFPQWQGIFSQATNISTGEGRIIAAIFFVGGIILYYMPSKNEEI